VYGVERFNEQFPGESRVAAVPCSPRDPDERCRDAFDGEQCSSDVLHAGRRRGLDGYLHQPVQRIGLDVSGREGQGDLLSAAVCVPRSSSRALASRVAIPAV
jgi:hypothetical protein